MHFSVANGLHKCYDVESKRERRQLDGSEMKKKMIQLDLLLCVIALCLIGCSLPQKAAVSGKQPVIETPDPAAERIEVRSSLPLPEAANPEVPDSARTPVPALTETTDLTPMQENPSPPAATPAQEATPAPLTTPALFHAAAIPEATDPDIVITKNPTSEALPVDGKTWFVARAENALSIAWQLIDPEGNLHTVTETAALNPGLELQMQEDTIEVSNVPLSFNGWAVQARFDSQKGTAVTSPAYIFVGDYINAYRVVIEKYRAAKIAEITTFGEAHNHDVSEWAVYTQQIGYAFLDLDRNGVPELLIAGIGVEDNSRYLLFDLYSFSVDHPVRVCLSMEKGRYYLLADGRIYYESSGNASIAVHEFYYLDGTKLRFLERYFSFIDSQDFGPYVYHMTQDRDRYLERKPEKDTERIPLSEFPAIRETFYKSMWMPPLAQAF